MRWTLAALATAIGVGGWAFAVFFMLGADEIESELTAARAELSKTKAEQSTLTDEVAAYQSAFPVPSFGFGPAVRANWQHQPTVRELMAS